MVFVAVSALVALLKQNHNANPEVVHEYAKTVEKYDASFKEFTVEEYANRYSVFEQNLAVAKKYNQKEMNRFFAYTAEEFKQKYLPHEYDAFDIKHDEKHAKNARVALQNRSAYQSVSVPKNFDWRNSKFGDVVGPVYDQNFDELFHTRSTCGSCWAWTSSQIFDTMYAIQHKKPAENTFSVQYLVDCDNQQAGLGYDKGCNGGLPETAYPFLQAFGHMKNSEYKDGKYHGFQELCMFDQIQTAKEHWYIHGDSVRAFSSASMKPGYIADEEAVKEFLYKEGPLFVAINAGSAEFQQYKGDHVLQCDNTNPYKLNHAVFLVGYGTDEVTGEDYWLVKNSWGSWWGNEGFVKIARGKNACGIAMNMSQVTQIYDVKENIQ